MMYFEYNTLTVGEEYLRHNRKKLWFPVQVEWSKKLRHFARVFFDHGKVKGKADMFWG